MGLLLKVVVLGVAAYMIWGSVRRWLGLLRGTAGNPPPMTSRRSPTQPGPGAGPSAPRRPVVEETRACPVCGAYVSVSSGACGRSNCPQT
jgi:hypothetical protein